MTWTATIVRNKAFDAPRRSDDTVEIDADQFDSEVMNALRDPQATPIESLQMSGDAKALAFSHVGPGRAAPAGGRPGVSTMTCSHSEVAQQMSLPIGTVKTSTTAAAWTALARVPGETGGIP